MRGLLKSLIVQAGILAAVIAVVLVYFWRDVLLPAIVFGLEAFFFVVAALLIGACLLVPVWWMVHTGRNDEAAGELRYGNIPVALGTGLLFMAVSSFFLPPVARLAESFVCPAGYDELRVTRYFVDSRDRDDDDISFKVHCHGELGIFAASGFNYVLVMVGGYMLFAFAVFGAGAAHRSKAVPALKDPGRAALLALPVLVLALLLAFQPGPVRAFARSVQGILEPDGYVTALHRAARAGDVAEATRLVDGGADVNARDAVGVTPVLYAFRAEHYAVADVLARRGADLDLRSDSGRIALAGWAGSGDVERMARWIALGADVNARDRNGRTALMATFEHNRIRAAMLLIAHGADLALKDQGNRTAADHAARAAEGDVRMVHLLELVARDDTPRRRAALLTLLQHGYALTHWELVRAAKAGDAVALEAFIAGGLSLDEPVVGRAQRPAQFQKLPLHEAVDARHMAAVRVLVKGGANLNHHGPAGWTPLELALFDGNVPMVAYLLEQGADPNVRNSARNPAWEAVYDAPRATRARLKALLRAAGARGLK